jgi:hypothetical protein
MVSMVSAQNLLERPDNEVVEVASIDTQRPGICHQSRHVVFFVE